MRRSMRVFVADEDGKLVEESDLASSPNENQPASLPIDRKDCKTVKHKLPPIKCPPRRTWRDIGKAQVMAKVEVWKKCAHLSCKIYHKIDKSFSFTAHVLKGSDPFQEAITSLGGIWPAIPIDWGTVPK